MGVERKIGINQFPSQGTFLHKPVSVCFNYDTAHTIPGVVIRDDTEEPGLMIIRLADGRVVLSTECQYSVASEVLNG